MPTLSLKTAPAGRRSSHFPDETDSRNASVRIGEFSGFFFAYRGSVVRKFSAIRRPL